MSASRQLRSENHFANIINISKRCYHLTPAVDATLKSISIFAIRRASKYATLCAFCACGMCRSSDNGETLTAAIASVTYFSFSLSKWSVRDFLQFIFWFSLARTLHWLLSINVCNHYYHHHLRRRRLLFFCVWHSVDTSLFLIWKCFK